MVHIIDDFYVNNDSYCYISLIDTHTVDKENKKVYKTIGYYQDMKNAICGIAKYMRKNINNENSIMELNDYLKKCKEINDTLDSILERIEG